MSVSLRGNLKDFGLADVFQLIGQQRKTGVLEFTGRGEKIQFLFDRGAIVSAAPAARWSHAALGEMLLRCGLLTRERVDDLRRECETSARTLPDVAIAHGWLSAEELRQIEDLLTRETIFSVLRWSGGSFIFTAEEIEHDRAFDSLLGAEQILMDGLRMVDEWQSFADLVPSEDTVFQRLGSIEQYSERSGREGERSLAAADRVLSLIDGRLAVRRIIDLSLLGTFDAVRALASLHRVRVIEPVDPAGLRALKESEEASRVVPKRPRRFIGVALPLALLLLVVGATQFGGDPSPDPFRIQRPSQLDAARLTYQKRRVRHALETYWFSEGHWPDRLEELESYAALAPEMGRPYYYANREDGPWLLGPDR